MNDGLAVSENLRAYYLRRAEESLELAARAHDPGIASVHMELHERYKVKAAAADGPALGSFRAL